MDKRLGLCEEYEHTLSVVSRLKQHDKAFRTLDSIPGSHDPMLEALILSEDMLAELRQRVPKDVRKDVESRWGFTRMVMTIDRQLKETFNISPLSSMLHTYGMSSHLIHADETGLGTIRARDRLEEPKLSAVVQSHRIALLDIIAGTAMLSTLAVAWAAQIKLVDAALLTETYKSVHGGSY